ncbi:hypothetical protein ADEAN_000368500 [Angomonas deanei]|uniref:Uncharacterized protein n=1 Tax=Angomonas deanei TaxID=59799 RepID=A0A7G2CBA6_9TRYP|nr:hypothetical protein ADEAN_000368500 [Angomonas deanei]
MSNPPPAGVNMPKKRDPRLKGLQAPVEKQFFDSADYEVRKQQQQGNLPEQRQQKQAQRQQPIPVAPQRQQAPPPPPPNAD